MSEFDEIGRILTTVVFSPDNLTILGYRQYHYSANEKYYDGYSDYRLIDGQLKRTFYTKNYWIEKDIKHRCDIFNDKNELIYYEVIELDNNHEMIWDCKFDNNDNPISQPLPIQFRLKRYTDY